MAWKECDRVSLRREFVALASVQGACIATLCRRFGIARKTGYKWLDRYHDQGPKGLLDRTRRPHRCRMPTPPEVEARVLEARDRHPAWGGRKLHHWLRGQGLRHVPAPSTITAILGRHGRLGGELDPPRAHPNWKRFEYPEPNDLWQMDFKGGFPLARGGACHTLAVLDDHSRYALAIRACGDQRQATVQGHLQDVFRRHGLPRRMLMDNGSPWGVTHGQGAYTGLTAWLLRLGVRVIHGRPHHPQTQGKQERFHRTLELEVLSRGPIDDLVHAQRRFDRWRGSYNCERPHEALGMDVPASRYRVSPRTFPEPLPAVEYAEDVTVRKVSPVGQFSFRGRLWKISEAFGGEPIGLRPTTRDGVWTIQYCGETIGELDLRSGGGPCRRLPEARPGGQLGVAEPARSNDFAVRSR
jgi:transposase InsO family protein